MTIVIKPPRDYAADEQVAVEALLLLSQSYFPTSLMSSSKKPTPTASKPPLAAALCVKNLTPAASKPPVSAALHAKNPSPAAARPETPPSLHAKNPSPAATPPPVAALHAKNPTPATATPPVTTATCPNKTQDLSPLHPSPSNLPYVCKICSAAFEKPQSLGGHKTCHRGKPTTTTAALTITGSRNSVRVYECYKCQMRFSSGQALGGHMRKHYDGKIGSPSKSPKTSSTGSPGRVSSEDDGPSNASTRLLDFDLNLPCPESDNVFE